jgi:hypothetical protein
MFERRINSSKNMWFQKKKKKLHEPLKDLHEELEEDIVVIAARNGGFLSFWKKYHIHDTIQNFHNCFTFSKVHHN